MDPDQVELEEADKRADAAKASLRRRLSELERRAHAVKDRLDVGSRITANPRLAVGIAAGAGALLGLLGASRRAPSAPSANIDTAGATERTFGHAILAALGALAVQGLKDLVINEGRQMATSWWENRTERDASRDPRAVEPFLEH